MSRLSEYQTFLTEFLRSYNTTGAVIPSGRALCHSLCRYVGAGGRPQRILEAGPGTGAVTRCIIDRMGQDDQLWMVELNPAFAAHLRRAFEDQPAFRAAASRCHLVEGALQQLGHDEPFDLVISGLPLNNFSSEDVRAVMQAFSKLLKPGGVLSFFEYILVRPAKMFVSAGAERARLRGVGEAIGSVVGEKAIAKEWVWVNVPPAWVHHVRF
jgi:phospholipid N-methyltransferase